MVRWCSRAGRLASGPGLGLLGLLALAACGDNLTPTISDDDREQVFHFGPYELPPGGERANDCVSVTLHNELPLFVNQVELATGAGFHHSNWFWVPETAYAGPDGLWRCDARGYDEALAAAAGGVLFAQSTQATGEVQAFPAGAAIAIPPRSKLVAGIHLLNPSDRPLTTGLDLTLTSIAREEMTVQLQALSFTYEALALPPGLRSTFTVECDLAELSQRQLGRAPDFNLYYVLPHYHELGQGIELTATGPGGDVPVVRTEGAIGEPLGRTLSPPFSLAGHTGLRFTCRFDNPRDQVVRWGIGDQEMCVMLAFTDSELVWGGGALDREPGPPTDEGGVLAFHHPCELFAISGNRW